MVVDYIDALRDRLVEGKRLGVESICEALKDADVQIAPSTSYASKTRPPSARAVRAGQATTVPKLVDAFGFGRGAAAELLLVASDNIERVRSEAAWARLCGIAAIPAWSGKTSRHRLNWGGHRQDNAALYRIAIVRMQRHDPTKAYVTRRTPEGKSKKKAIGCLQIELLDRRGWVTRGSWRTPCSSGSRAEPQSPSLLSRLPVAQ